MSLKSREKQLRRDGHRFGSVPKPRVRKVLGLKGEVLGVEGIPQEMSPERVAWILEQRPEWRKDLAIMQWLGLAPTRGRL